MSNTSVFIAIDLLAFIVLAVILWRQRDKIQGLRNGQRQWKEIAAGKQKANMRLADTCALLANKASEIERRMQSAYAQLADREKELSEVVRHVHQLDPLIHGLKFLIENQLAIYDATNEHGPKMHVMHVMQVCTTGTPVGSGTSIVSAIEDARIALARVNQGVG